MQTVSIFWINMFLSVLCMLLKAFVSCNIFRFLSLQGKRFLGARFLSFFFFYARKSTMLKLQKREGNRASQRQQGRGWGERQENAVFFLPSPSLLSFFRPSTYPKGCYFYSPQCSFVRISKTAATIIQT